MHTIHMPGLGGSDGRVTISGEEAHHAARVKRLEAGDALRLCDGKGLVCDARIAEVRKTRDGFEIAAEITSRREVAPDSPRVTVCAAAPKGDRLEAMIDGLSQVGAAGWQPLLSRRTVVEPRAGKLERLQRVTVESMKQCGRAWAMRIEEPVDFSAALRSPGRVVIADASGAALRLISEDQITLLVGPEGGWTPEELREASDAGATVAAFGVHVMRTEVAAVVACAAVMQAGRDQAVAGSA